MKSPATFGEYIGNTRAVEIVRRAVEQNRLPHAMIFAGPAGVGKRTLALLVARLLNCVEDCALRPCGRCAQCRKILAGSHPDVREIEPEGTVIKIEQVRAVIREVAYRPFEARCRVVVLDPADQMRPESHNSLLKTLEEPPTETVIILITTNPYLLLTTIRSRARLLQFGGIPQRQIEDLLVRQEGRAPEEAHLAALFSNGSLGSALSFDSGAFREARQSALRFAKMLLGREGFAEASPLAADATKEKETFQIWLEALTAVLHDTYYMLAAPDRIGQPDIRTELAGLARAATRESLVSAIRAVRRLKRELMNNVNRQLSLEALFLSQSDASTARSG